MKSKGIQSKKQVKTLSMWERGGGRPDPEKKKKNSPLGNHKREWLVGGGGILTPDSNFRHEGTPLHEHKKRKKWVVRHSGYRGKMGSQGHNGREKKLGKSGF